MESNNTMEKILEARKLLRRKAEEVNFEDDVYSMVHAKVGELINEVEDELGCPYEGNDEYWYDEVRDEIMYTLYDRIGKGLRKEMC